MALLTTEDFEGGTNGAAVTTANTSATAVSGSPVFTTTAFSGALGCHLPAGSHAVRIQHTAGPDIWYAIPIRLTSIPGSHTQVLSFQSGSTQIADIQIAATTGQVRLRNGFVLASTTNAALTAGAWYQLAVRVRPGVGLTLRLYNATGTFIEQITGASTTGTTVDRGILQTSGTNTGTTFDWVRVDNATEPAPYVVVVEDPSNTFVRVGGAWVEAQPHVRISGAWVAADAEPA